MEPSGEMSSRQLEVWVWSLVIINLGFLSLRIVAEVIMDEISWDGFRVKTREGQVGLLGNTCV